MEHHGESLLLQFAAETVARFFIPVEDRNRCAAFREDLAGGPAYAEGSARYNYCLAVEPHAASFAVSRPSSLSSMFCASSVGGSDGGGSVLYQEK